MEPEWRSMVIVSVVDRPVASLKAAGGTRLGWGAQMASADGAEWGELWGGMSPPHRVRTPGYVPKKNPVGFFG